VAEAFAWGLIAGSSLLLRGLLALRRPVGQHTLGLVMAVGADVLISTVAYELVEDAFGIAGGSGAVALGLFAGAFAFYFGDLAIDRFGGEKEECGRGSGRGFVPRHRARSIVARRRAGFRCARDA
jgi:zinc transporter, ZIP family